MRTGRGTRSAAVLMTGLVGAAVIAPGVAFADDTTTGPSVASCAALNQVYDASTGACLSAQEIAARTRAALAEQRATIQARAEAAQERAQAAAQTAREQAAAAAEAARTTAPSTTPPATTSSTTPSTATDPSAGADAATTAATTAATDDEQAAATAARSTVSAAEATAALEQLTGQDRSALPIDEALKDLPTGNLDLGDADIPDYPASGSFSNPREACLYLASKVDVDEADAAAVGEQFLSFCGALPSSFDPATGYGTLPDLIAVLDKLCHGLKDTHHHRYGWHGRDLDCGDFVGDQSGAQAVLEADRSDPNNLDGDNDGKACDWNSDDHEVEAASYEGYPQGGVATGDSAPGVAPGSAVALAGLALAGLAGATRRREEDDLEADAEVRA